MADAPVSFTLDGRVVTARPGELVISAAERAGTFIPRFCYHPRMAPVGVCRMCLVEIDGPRGPTLQPACFVSVTESMQVVTDSAKVKKAQDGVLEFLLVNHPLDCPVCDKGGECPLQDQTLTHGSGDTRFLEEKRHFEKPIALSDLVLLDRERCIQCARCTRFAAEVAGEAQIDFAGRGEQLEVAAFPTEPFRSHYSGNTVQICPVGALTATPYRFTARPWDLDQVESTCTTCAVGCRVAVQSSANRITRLLGVDSEPVNHGWLCDKGRFAYEATNGPESDGEVLGYESPRRRLDAPLVRRDGVLVEATWGEAIARAADALRRASTVPGGVGAIGGAALTNEGQYQWVRLLKGVVGTDSVDAQLGDGLDPLLVSALPRATIDETVGAKVVVLLAGDLNHELPVLYLRLRAAARESALAIVELAPFDTPLSGDCAVSIKVRPGEAPDVVSALLGEVSAAQRLAAHPEGPASSPDALATGRDSIPVDGDGVVVVLGRPNVAEAAAVIDEAARRLLRGLPKARFLVALRRGNVAGALDMGLAPGLLPGRVRLDDGREWFTRHWGSVPATVGLDARGQLEALAAHTQRALVVLGCDPLADTSDAELAATALRAADDVLVIGGHGGPVLAYASVVLPACVAHERGGTTTNLEARIARLGQKVVAPGVAWTDVEIAAELHAALGAGELEAKTDVITDEIAAACATHRGITARALLGAEDGIVIGRGPASPRQPLDPIAFPGVRAATLDGLRTFAGAVEEPEDPGVTAEAPVSISVADVLASAPDFEPPSPDAYSLRLVAVRCLYDRGAAVTASHSLAQLAEPAVVRASPYDLDRIGAHDGDEVRLRTEQRLVVVRCAADPSVVRGTLCIGLNVDAAGVDRIAATFVNPSSLVTEVRMESL